MAEHRHHFCRESEAQHGNNHEERRAEAHDEPIALTHPGVKTRTVTETAHGLETLPQTDYRGKKWTRLDTFGAQTLASNGKIHKEMCDIIKVGSL